MAVQLNADAFLALDDPVCLSYDVGMKRFAHVFHYFLAYFPSLAYVNHPFEMYRSGVHSSRSEGFNVSIDKRDGAFVFNGIIAVVARRRKERRCLSFREHI